jgi:Transposase DDE domain group 1
VATECHRRSGFRFQRKLTVDFAGGTISGDAGLVVLREFDARLGLTKRLAAMVRDPRDERYVDHELMTLLRQRIYQIAAGYEDGNDANFLRNEPTMQAVAGVPGEELASQPTHSRLENEVDWDSVRLLESEGTEWFCRHGRTEGEIILDMDSTEDRTYGQQAFSFYNAHYNSYMYHPLLVFEGKSGVLLASRLRPGNAMGSRQVVSLLRPMVRRLRAAFPERAVALRADGAFSSPEVLDYAEYAGMEYAIGFGRNERLLERIMPLCEKAELLWECNADRKRVRLYTSFRYQARRWSRARRVVAKIERTREGINMRFIVSNRRGRAEDIFDWYEQRGQAENFIKEFKNDLAGDRLSCSAYRANAFRLQLHAVAYNLFALFRRHVLAGTELARATVTTIRLRVLKIGARIKHSARRLWFHLASGWPGRSLLIQVLDGLAAIGPPPTCL